MDRTEHLKLIQAVVDRLARNSFTLKGWTVAIAVALLGLAAKDSDRSFALLAIYVVAAFGSLDAYYLALERRYRSLYNKGLEEDLKGRMTIPREWRDIGQAFASPSVWMLHGSVLLIAACVLFTS